MDEREQVITIFPHHNFVMPKTIEAIVFPIFVPSAKTPSHRNMEALIGLVSRSHFAFDGVQKYTYFVITIKSVDPSV